MRKHLSTTAFAALGVLALSLSACATASPDGSGTQGSSPTPSSSESPAGASSGASGTPSESSASSSAGASSEPTGTATPSSGGESSDSAGAKVFNFSGGIGKAAAKGQSLKITLPEDLKTAATKSDTDWIITGYTLTPRQLKSKEFCGIDVKIEYGPGGREKLLKRIGKTEYEGFSEGATVADVATSGIYETLDYKEFDPSDPYPANYSNKDGSNILYVRSCGSSATDLDAAATFKIFYYDETTKYDTNAGNSGIDVGNLTVVTLPDRRLSVAEASTGGWERDSAGKWFMGE